MYYKHIEKLRANLSSRENDELESIVEEFNQEALIKKAIRAVVLPNYHLKIQIASEILAERRRH